MDDSVTRSVELLSHYDPESVTVLHIAEKGDGTPDKTPAEQPESVATASFKAIRKEFRDVEPRPPTIERSSGGIRDGRRRRRQRQRLPLAW